MVGALNQGASEGSMDGTRHTESVGSRPPWFWVVLWTALLRSAADEVIHGAYRRDDDDGGVDVLGRHSTDTGEHQGWLRDVGVAVVTVSHPQLILYLLDVRVLLSILRRPTSIADDVSDEDDGTDDGYYCDGVDLYWMPLRKPLLTCT